MKSTVRNFLFCIALLASRQAFASLQLLDPQIYQSEFDYLNTRSEGKILEGNIGEFSQDDLRSLIHASNLTPEDSDYLLKTTDNTFENSHMVVNLDWKNFFALHNSPDLKFLELDAYTNPFFVRDNGVYGRESYAGTAGQLYLEAFRFLSFNAQPYFLFHDVAGQDHFYMKEVYGSLNINKLSVDFGKIRLHWGYGAYESMAFSSDMAPFFMVRVRNNEEIVFDNFLSFLGKIKFEIFYGWLDQFRTYPNGNIIGSTFSFQPTDRLHLHFTETVLYGGDGAPSNSPLLFFNETFVDHVNPANRNSSVGIRYRIPEIEIEPYFDLYIEDCCNTLILNPRDMVHLVGLYLPPKDPGKKFDLAIEWVRTNFITYRHEAFPYTQSQRVLGHPVGPDATGFYVISRYFQSKRLQFETLFAYEIRGLEGRALQHHGYKDIRTVEPSFEDGENRYRWEEYIHFLSTPSWKWTLHLGIEKIYHKGYAQNVTSVQGIFGLETSYDF